MKSTIDLLHKQLDRTPEDHDLRLVLADALEEEGSVLAAGYRASVACGRRAEKWVTYRWAWWDAGALGLRWNPRADDTDEIPRDWWRAIEGGEVSPGRRGKGFATRRLADDAVALAFTKLPPERQRELLDGRL